MTNDPRVGQNQSELPQFQKSTDMEVSEVMGSTPNHSVVMDDHDLVLKTMVTWGSPICSDTLSCHQ